MSLIIVESSEKAQTLASVLDDEFSIAVAGPLKRLPTNSLGVDLKSFMPAYVTVPRYKSLVRSLQSAAQGPDRVYFAQEPDEVGEEQAWHLAEAMGVPRDRIRRLSLHDLSPSGVELGLRRAGELDLAKYETQQRRRVADRIIEHLVSQALRGIRPGLVAGRLANVGLRILIETPRLDGSIPQHFGTAKMLRLAAQHLGFDAARTMRVARRLYEHGLLTFPTSPRTILPVSITLPPEQVQDREAGALYGLVWREWFNPSRTTFPDDGPLTVGGLLVALEVLGVGGPSTYEGLLTTVLRTEFVRQDESGRLHPTELALAMNDLLTKTFPGLFEVDTAVAIEQAIGDWDLWNELAPHLHAAVSRGLSSVPAQPERLTELPCERCQQPMQLRWYRKREAATCRRCRVTRLIQRTADGSMRIREATLVGRDCPDCGKPLSIQFGRYGQFAGCTGYPDCTTTQPVELPIPTGTTCPVCGVAEVIRRKARGSRKEFISCRNYPTCTYSEKGKKR